MAWNNLTYAGWGRARSASGKVARPERQSALSRDVATTPAPAFGLRRSYGDVALNDGGTAYDMSRLDRVLSFDAETGVVEVEAGMPVGALARSFAKHGWLPAVMPGTGFATVGGSIANDVHGKNHHTEGTFGQHVTEITLLQGNRVEIITPESGTIWQATIGGLGQTGVIAKAKLQLMPCPGELMKLRETRIANLDAFLKAFDDSDAPYAVGWIDATATGDRLGRGIFEESELVAGRDAGKEHSRAVPLNAPGWALSAPIVRLFNEAYYRRIPARGKTSVKPIWDVLFPLDAIHDWNRLYGKRGFNQFQCVIPPERVDMLRTMLERIGASHLASPLAVLKKMGAARGGYMSFPMAGYTLAVDFPNRDGATELISDLTDMTHDAGGRIYFAKDGVAEAAQVKGMYPEQGDWVKAAAKADPGNLFETDLVRRLELRDIAHMAQDETGA
ncbi:FAD-binding protein [Celeribacter neptunius]|uniref:Decaprenylphospho-beta-D-ribofuranose 2-oxidase n=1 Tax=Celeribacter neptunius TaxID=588602 RepID=A0A1I3TNN8_9RHOB|nr:FAD-binding oxidoreductase [Celeribacter neptunius]SFJ72475.1 decaprenylphospho-beta-D-ribofuranose 2-oxidase [Celeribacter neptunius]